MNKKMLLLLFLFTCKNYSQVIKTINKLDVAHQDCLDNPSKNMANCTINYYNKLDSLLNVEYKKIRSGLNASQQKES